jgi:hypothetical protein
MVLSVSISPEAEARLRAKAKAAGVDMATYAAQQLEMLAHPLPRVSDISGPIAEQFAQSGMSEEELAQFLEAEKHAMRSRKPAPVRSPLGPVETNQHI